MFHVLSSSPVGEGVGSWVGPPHLPSVFKRNVLELRGKKQQILLAEYLRLVYLFASWSLSDLLIAGQVLSN